MRPVRRCVALLLQMGEISCWYIKHFVFLLSCLARKFSGQEIIQDCSATMDLCQSSFDEIVGLEA